MSLTFNPFTGQFDFTGVSGGGVLPPARYTATFNNTTDWTLSAPDYTHTIAAATHGRGTSPNVQVYESIGGGSYEQVTTNVTVSATGDVTLKVSQVPNNRFTGLVLII